MEIFFKKIGKFDAKIIKDEFGYTITPANKSKYPPFIGVVVSSEIQSIAEKKFKEAMTLANVVSLIETLRMSKLN